MTDVPYNAPYNVSSTGRRPYINITVIGVEAEEGRWDFYGRYRRDRLALAPTYVAYEPGLGGSEGQYVWGSYIMQPQDNDCRYHVLEHAYPSWNAPGVYGFIISTGICEEDLPVYGQQRDVILNSFDEIE